MYAIRHFSILYLLLLKPWGLKFSWISRLLKHPQKIYPQKLVGFQYVHYYAWRVVYSQNFIWKINSSEQFLKRISWVCNLPTLTLTMLMFIMTLPYSAKLWRWKSLTKFDEWSISESLTSKTLTNWVRFLLALVKINYCQIIMCSWGLRTELASYNNFK